MAIVPHVILFKQLQVKMQARLMFCVVLVGYVRGSFGIQWFRLLGIGNSKYGVCGKCIFVEMDGCILAS